MISVIRKYYFNYKLLFNIFIISGFVYQIYDQTVNYLEYEVNTDLKFDRKAGNYYQNFSVTLCLNKEYSVYKNKTIQEYLEHIGNICLLFFTLHQYTLDYLH